MSRTLQILLLIWCMTAIPHGVYANVDCADLFKGAISAEALELLREAHNGPASFKVDILKTNIDGKDKFVVLLGETHGKFKEDSDLGKEILKHFDLRGLETRFSKKNHNNFYKNLDAFKKKSSRTEFGFYDSTIADAARVLNEDLSNLEEISSNFFKSSHPNSRKITNVFLEYGKNITPKENIALWMLFIFPLFSFHGDTLLKERDPYMANAIKQSLHIHQEYDAMLAIIGKAHNAGIKEWLLANGFEEVRWNEK